MTAPATESSPTYPPALTNADVAALFDELADSLEILGENSFKVRAYRNAVATLLDLPEPVARVAADNRLASLAGFGDAIQAKTSDFLAAGTTKALEDARRKVPRGAAELLRLPGVGAKTVGQLITQLEISSLADLEAALDAQRVRAAAGMGEKTEAKLRDALERYRRYSRQLVIADAAALADALVGALRARSEVVAADAAGAVRRGEESVSEVMIVAATRDAAATLEAFASLPQIAGAAADAPTPSLLEPVAAEPPELSGMPGLIRLPDTLAARSYTASAAAIRSGSACPITLALTDAPGYAALLEIATGTETHVSLLNVYRAKRNAQAARGALPVSLPTDGAPAASGADAPADAAIYAALDLPWIAPELRQGSGELAAAIERRLPRLVTLQDIRGDLHSHTSASDGASTIDEMAAAARARGYAYLAVTDHSRSLTVANGLTPERLLEQIRQVRDASQRHGIALLTGTECDIKADGALDFPDELLAELDIVIASVHSRFNQPSAEMTARIVRALENPHVDLLAHPTGRLINQREPYALDIDAVIAAAARTRTALEINAFPERQDLRDAHARKAKEAGVPISIDTDAHAPEHFALMRWGVSVARRGWLEAGDVLNARSYEELMEWLRERR